MHEFTRRGALIALLACLLLPGSHAQIVNGSFETGDYTGWTLFQGGFVVVPRFGTWGIAASGETVSRGNSTFDFYDQINVVQVSPGLPITFVPTDGSQCAYSLINGRQVMRMYQDVTLPTTTTDLTWDMRFQNHATLYAPNQRLQVNLRNPVDDSLLATLFTTDPTSALSMPMMAYQADISAYAGTDVRISVDMDLELTFFDAVFDNFAIQTLNPQVSCTTDVIDLWPPDHSMSNVTVTVTATDFPASATAGGIPPFTVSAASSEPDDAPGTGDGQTVGDVNGVDGFVAPADVTALFVFDATIGTAGAWVGVVPLRAERDAAGPGRTYTLTVTGSVGSVTTTSACLVTVSSAPWSPPAPPVAAPPPTTNPNPAPGPGSNPAPPPCNGGKTKKPKQKKKWKKWKKKCKKHWKHKHKKHHHKKHKHKKHKHKKKHHKKHGNKCSK